MKPMSVLPALFAGLAVAALLIAPPALVHAQAKKSAKIAVALFGPHESLHQVVDGFKQELAAQGITATYDEGNVNFDRSLVPQFLNRLAASNPDLMLTVTTPMTQSARQILASRSFPIVFAPVTDPVAAKLVPSWDKGDALMTGASNLPDLAATLEFIKALVPGTKRVGILFNPGDDSDVTFVSRLEAIAPKHAVELVKVGVDNANDIPVRIQSLQGRADALFIPASSLLQPAGAAIAATANRIKLPVFNSNTAQVRSHQMLAAYSVDWKKVGINAGAVAAEILNGKPPSEIPVRLPRPEDHEVVISGQRLKDLGLTLPASLKDCNCVVD
ncbi:MAG: ABC transporter substrate-binding protein [Lautropia sp.]